jgi:hypothetical protein
MRRLAIAALLVAAAGTSRLKAQKSTPQTVTESLANVKRIYVAPLTGGAQADALRDLIISSLDGTKLFVLTDNEARADAVLKGAADDHTYTDSFDSLESGNGRMTAGVSNGTGYSRSGINGGIGLGETDAHHDKVRMHEAYAALRLCNRDGDVIWSTTQESGGGKFRGASADVAARVAHQIGEDFERARQAALTPPTVTPKPVN